MNQKELANRLRQNPDALQSVLRSPDGQRLLQLLRQLWIKHPAIPPTA